MSLLDTLRSGIKTADSITKPLQATVIFERHTGSDGYGTPIYNAPVSLRAIVDYTRKQVRTIAGVLTVSRVTITLLNIAEVVAATSGEGVGNFDRFTLPDGDVVEILDLSGFLDAQTGHPIATEVVAA